MLSSIRPRVNDEEGISLIEMMVAMFILSVGVLGLLSTFTASARSIVEQRGKTTATRVASDVLEDLRGRVWHPDEPDFAALPYNATGEPHTADGTDYLVDTTVDWADPSVTGGIVEALKTVEVTVRWTVAGTERSTTVRTAVEGTSTPPTDAQIVIDMIPNPVHAFRLVSNPNFARPVDPSGKIDVRIQVQNWDYGGQMYLRWTNANGANKSMLLDKVGDEWTASLPATSSVPPSQAHKEVIGALDDEDEGRVVFTVETATGTLSTTYWLDLFGYNEFDPGFQVSPSPIQVSWHTQHGCHGTNRCRNQQDTWFVVSWPADAPANTTVTVSWGQPSPQTVNLLRHATSPGTWYRQVNREGNSPHPHRPWETANRQFMPGDLPFVVTVREGDVIVTQASFKRPVVPQ